MNPIIAVNAKLNAKLKTTTSTRDDFLLGKIAFTNEKPGYKMMNAPPKI